MLGIMPFNSMRKTPSGQLIIYGAATVQSIPTIMLVTLKLFGAISWSWWLVTIPLWFPFAHNIADALLRAIYMVLLTGASYSWFIILKFLGVKKYVSLIGQSPKGEQEGGLNPFGRATWGQLL